MIRAAVLGAPISHSLSPILHNRAYEILGVVGEYSKIEVGESEFASFFNKAKTQDWSGFSLTMPLKEVAIGQIADVGEAELAINSVNTLLNERGQWRAISTDRLAFENLIPVESDSRVAVLGAGGTARAAIGALAAKVLEVDVFIRSENRKSSVLKAARDMKVNFLTMDSDLSNYDFVVATLPKGGSDLIAQSVSNPSGKLLEVLYSPWPTNLASKWIESEKEVISGLELLVEQALYQIQYMTKMDFDFASMREQLLVTGSQALNKK
jgi:shikimate dehydrogenase